MKTITVPKSIEAEKLLDLNACVPEMLDEIVLSQEQFDKLWAIGIFCEINKICGSMIDDYENESISKPESIQAVLNFIQSKHWNEDVSESIRKIENLFINAKEYKTSVHFYF